MQRTIKLTPPEFDANMSVFVRIRADQRKRNLCRQQKKMIYKMYYNGVDADEMWILCVRF
jgi:hypothetical protein